MAHLQKQEITVVINYIFQINNGYIIYRTSKRYKFFKGFSVLNQLT